MKTEKAYVVSFGDSDKYSVPFDGSKVEFEKSKEFKQIKDAIFDYVKARFPEAKYEDVINPGVAEIMRDDQVYPVLDADNLEKLKQDVVRQVEVKGQDREMDSDAPYSNVN